MFNNIMLFLYIFLDILPFSIPRYYLFIDFIAIPIKWLATILVSLTIIEALGFIYIINQPWSIELYLLVYHYTFVFIFALLSFIFIKEKFSKVMFVYLMMFCYGGFILGNAHFIETRFFLELSIKHPYLINNLVKIILITITYSILFYILKNYFKKVMNVIDSDIWKYIWMIPLMFSSIGAIYSSASSKANMSEISFIFLRYLILIGTFFTCFILLKTLKQTEINTRLEENIKYKKNQLNLQKEQYIMLTKNIEETKKARHDLKHHLSLIQTFLNDGEYNKLKDYIKQYKNSLPVYNELSLCENYIVDAIVRHYVILAKQENISVAVDLKIPAKTSIADLDFCIILGNCLENAIEACNKIIDEEKFISIKSQTTNFMIGLIIDNSFAGQIIKEDDYFLSSKRVNMKGIGLSSVYSVVSKYDGTAKFDVDSKNKVFKTSILLKNKSTKTYI